MKKVLTIAGSDCSGGAGIQADLKTMTAMGVYGMSAITALTAQNTTGVYGVLESDDGFLANQLDCIFKDIFPDAVKIGMVSSSKLIHIIAQKLIEYKASNIVLDTVMVSTSGSPLLQEEAVEALKSELIPVADVITPNIPEAQVLLNNKINNIEDMKESALSLYNKYGCSVIIKGGHLVETATDVICSNGEITVLKGERVDNDNTHGTGCTLSSAIACGLAKGYNINEATKLAKEYLTGALKSGLNLGKGSGPVDHCWNIRG